MNAQYNQFIGMYNNVYRDGFCNHMITEFERVLSQGLCGNRQDSEGATKTRKQDNFYFLNLRQHSLSSFNGDGALPIFMNGLQRCFDDYVAEYDILKDIDLKCTSVKMQKTDPGAGYHVWHSEQGNGPDSARCLVYSLYLNDIEEAGETEFLYQKLRISPKENSMVIWPAAFTHTHRGNVVHGTKSKYIITGWFYLD
jgi:2OG-Fe(II) oxygenase superfamily